MRALALAAALSVAGAVHAQTTYDLTVVNSFGAGEYYGATPQDGDIWLLSNFQFDYWNGTEYVTGNSTAGTYGTAVPLSSIIDGKVKLYAADNGTRMYAVLSQGSTPDFSSLATAPNNYFEWSFSSGNPGTLDLSWIDSWDFSTQMVVSANGTQSPAPTTVTYGGRAGVSSATIASNLGSYLTGPHAANYTWLGTTGGGFSQTLSYTGATNPIRWITNNSATQGQVYASTVTSFTNALTAIGTQSAASPAWVAGTPATGPNWTDKGFRIASTQPLTPPDGSALPGGSVAKMWSAYVNFTNSGGGYTMTLTDFTIYGWTSSTPQASNSILWNAVTNAAGATYSIGQSDGLLDAVWTSSPNALTSTPAWVTNLNGGGNGPNLWYALYNAVASGVIYNSDFVNNTELPDWAGYVPWVAGQDDYNFEILTTGAAVEGGRAGFLSGSDVVAMMQAQAAAGTLVNPYFLELLAAMQQTPAYLYPSQDFWESSAIGSDTFIGMQTGPLNGGNVFGDADLTWYLGGAAIPEPSTVLLLGVGGLAVWGWRRRLAAR